LGKASLKTIMDTKLIIAERRHYRERGLGVVGKLRAAQVCFPGVRDCFA